MLKLCLSLLLCFLYGQRVEGQHTNYTVSVNYFSDLTCGTPLYPITGTYNATLRTFTNIGVQYSYIDSVCAPLNVTSGNFSILGSCAFNVRGTGQNFVLFKDHACTDFVFGVGNGIANPQGGCMATTTNTSMNGYNVASVQVTCGQPGNAPGNAGMITATLSVITMIGISLFQLFMEPSRVYFF